MGDTGTATVTITIQGLNDAAVIGGLRTQASVKEDLTLTSSGHLTISDPDAGQNLFQVHDATNPVQRHAWL